MRLRTRPADESGVALITALLAVMLVGALAAGMFAAIQSDQRGSAIDRDQTQAYAAAHAGLEQFTSNLAQLFNNNVAPTTAQINALATQPPVIPGFAYTSPGGGSGYTITYPDVSPADGVPDVIPNADITTGQFTGLKGLITPYTMTVTARSSNGGSEVRLRRGLQTVAIPIFQFGIFSDSDLSIFAGGGLNFGGRVHTNGHLFLAPQSGSSIVFADRITAAGQVVRAFHSNSRDNSTTNPAFAGQLFVPTSSSTNRDLLRTEGSVVGMPGSAAYGNWLPLSTGTYKKYITSGTTGANRLDLPLVTQGAQPVDLIRRSPPNDDVNRPLVYPQSFYSQASLRILLSDRVTDFQNLPQSSVAAPVLLEGNWRVTPPGGYGPVDATHPPIARSAGSGSTTYANTLTNLGGGLYHIQVNAIPVVTKVPTLTIRQGINSWAVTCQGKTGATAIAGFNANSFVNCDTSPLPMGGISSPPAITVEATVDQRLVSVAVVGPIARNGAANIAVGIDATVRFSPNLIWVPPNTGGPAVPISCEGHHDIPPRRFLACRNVPALLANGPIGTSALADPSTGTIGGYIKIERRDVVAAGAPQTYTDVTMEILNLGIGDRNSLIPGGVATDCGDPTPNAVLRLQRLRDNSGGTCHYNNIAHQHSWDWWPQTLYDSREGTVRDAATTDPMRYAGVMQYSALDVNNLRRWLAGTIGTVGNQTAPAANSTGFIVYFSDRRGNHDAAANETGEFGFEDHVNSATANGLPDAAMQAGEDVNAVPGTLALPYVPTQELYGGVPWNNAANIPAGASTVGVTPYNTIPNNVAGQARASKVLLFRRALKLVNGGLGSLPAAGLTVAAENPVYVHGNYNADHSTSPWSTNPVWAQANAPAAVIGDVVTLLSRNWSDARSFEAPNIRTGRPALTTAYRFAALAGKGLSFPYCNAACGSPGDLFGTDGGAANFLRMLEDWTGQSVGYRGSLISLHINRQAIGTYKFGSGGATNNVYNAGSRQFTFDISFLNPALLPPGTPMFRDVNTLQFRQILRPNE